MPMQQYLELPAVGHKQIQTIVEDCPLLAWSDSWLNPDRPHDDSNESDIGTIAHSIFLEQSEAKVAVINPEDHPAEKGGAIPSGWTNKSIRRARDAARASGLIPVLAPQMAQIRAMARAATEYVTTLASTEPALYSAFCEAGGSEAEATFTWTEDGTLCKMRPDLISTDRRLIVNYKTTATSVNPDRWGRSQMIGAGHYIGAAWYRRGMRALQEIEPDYVYLVQSTAPPFPCSLVGVSPAAFELGGQKAAEGLKRWQRCVAENRWPGYVPRVVYPDIPAWEFEQWEVEMQMQEER